MANPVYYVKIRGRVIGPFPPERLVEMVRQGSLSRIHQISTDETNWRPAAEFSQFFAAAQTSTHAAARGNSAEPNNHFATPAAGANHSLHKSTSGGGARIEHPEAMNDDDEQWYYGINDQSTGPVSRSMLLDLLRSGQLSSSDMLWRSGMADWQPVESFREFRSIAVQTQGTLAPSENFSTKNILEVHNPGTVQQGSLASLIGRYKPWIYFVVVVIYIMVAVTILGSLVGLIQGIQQASFYMISQSLLGLVQAGLLMTAAVFLNQYAIASSRFVLSDKQSDLFSSLKLLGRFWFMIGLFLILTIVVGVIAVLYFYTLTGAIAT